MQTDYPTTPPENATLVGYIGPDLPIDAWKGELIPVKCEDGGYNLYKPLPEKKK